MISKLPVLNVYKKKTKKSPVVTQLLYGDKFKKLSQKNSWTKIKNDSDNYIGYIKSKNFTSNHKNTHKISSLSSNIFSQPSQNKKLKKKLTFASKIKVVKKSGNFYKFDNFWIKKKDLKKIKYKTKDIFKNVDKFINVKYKWGGKHFGGVDCSGLIQLFFKFK